MLNILSYVGMSLHSELCLWTLLGLLRTIFDATLFKVNANLKQVWQVGMPPQLTLPVQRVLRTMISGVMLVQCFTVYVYLASYIVLLYPIFVEERPTLVLPWLLLAAIRKFLCELTSLALGLGACVLLGPARPSCIKFVVFKIATITPAFYMWMLMYSYYDSLKVATAFKSFAAVLQSTDHDLGLELAVRRRRTKSLQDEEQVRKKLVAHFKSGGIPPTQSDTAPFRALSSLHPLVSTKKSLDNLDSIQLSVVRPLMLDRLSDIGSCEEWNGNESIPRDTDRILEQFVMMMLRIGAFLKTGETDASKHFNAHSSINAPQISIDCSALSGEDTDTPPQVANSKIRTSYLQEYPQIFMKKATEALQLTEQKYETLQTIHSDNGSDESTTKMIQKIVARPESDMQNRKESILKSNILKESESFEGINIILKPENFTHRHTEAEHHIKNTTEPDDETVTSVKDNKTEVAQSSKKTKVTLSLKDYIKDRPITTNKSDDLTDNKLLTTDSLQSVILKYKENGRKTDIKTQSVDSLQSVIDRMKKSLSAYRMSFKESSNEEINEDDMKIPTSSNTNRASDKKYINPSTSANAKEQSPKKEHPKND